MRLGGRFHGHERAVRSARGHAPSGPSCAGDFGKVSIECLLMKLRHGEREVEEIKNSTSWWVTAPLRRCANVARGSFLRSASR